jgi:hypothetical protein
MRNTPGPEAAERAVARLVAVGLSQVRLSSRVRPAMTAVVSTQPARMSSAAAYWVAPVGRQLSS